MVASTKDGTKHVKSSGGDRASSKAACNREVGAQVG